MQSISDMKFATKVEPLGSRAVISTDADMERLLSDQRRMSKRRVAACDLVRSPAMWTPHRKFEGTKARQRLPGGQD